MTADELEEAMKKKGTDDEKWKKVINSLRNMDKSNDPIAIMYFDN